MAELLAVVGWGVSGFFAYGLSFGYFEREYACLGDGYRLRNRALATFMFLCGPIGLAVAFFDSGCGRHGLKWK